MSTREFPRYGAGQPLTAAQVNALIDQMRRQARIYATPPLDAVQTPEGWLVRVLTAPGFWGRLGARQADGDGVRYDYVEVFPDAFGGWSQVPGGRTGAGRAGAAEANDRTDLPPAAIVWLTGAEGAGVEGASAAFVGPPVRTGTGPDFFWARLLGEEDGAYQYTRLIYTDAGFTPDPASDPAEYGGARAREATGRTDAAVGSVVLMRTDPGSTYGSPVFSVAAVAAGYWAMYQAPFAATATVEIELSRKRFPTLPAAQRPEPVGGTWTFTVLDPGAGTIVPAPVSAPLPYNATVAQVRAAVEGMTGLVFGGVAVSGTDGGPWVWTLQNEHAAGTLRINTTGLDYGGAPPSTGGGFADGPYSGYTYGAGTSVNGAWKEVTRSTAGSWMLARDPRSTSDVFPANAFSGHDVLVATAGTVAFLEPAGRVPAGGSVRPTINTGGLTGLAAGGAAVLPDGTAALVVVQATGGTFTLTHQGVTSPPIPFNATADQVAAAVNTGRTTNANGVLVYGVTGSQGPVATGVRLDWTDPATGNFVAERVLYTYDRAFNQTTEWFGGGEGRSRLVPVGYSFNEEWELRTFHPLASGGRPTGGTFTLKYGGAETAPLAFDASRQDVQDALEPLAGRGNLSCAGGPLPAPVHVLLAGDLAGKPSAGLALGDVSLTVDPPDAAAQPVVFRPASRTVRTTGSPGSTLAAAVPFTITCGSQTTSTLPYSATGANVYTAILTWLSNTIGGRKVVVSGLTCGPWRLVFRDQLAVTPPPPFTFAVPSPGEYTVAATDGTADGVAGGPDGGTVRLCVGSQWKVELNGPPGSSVRFRVNGVLTSPVPWGASASDLAGTLGSFGGISLPGTSAVIQGTGLSDGGPLGTAPVFIELGAWLPERAVTIAVDSTAYAPPAPATPVMSATLLEEFSGDAATFEFAAVGPSGGTWTIPGLVGTGPLPWNADAAAVQALVRGYTTTVGGGFDYPPETATPHQPFGDATCSGGPLPGASIYLRVPTDLAARWRRYAGGLVPPWPAASLFAPNAAGLTASVPPTADVTATVTWLGTPDLSVAGLTAATVEAALRATPYGDRVRCADATDAIGGIVLAVPDYAGPVAYGNTGKRFSAFGYASGGRLVFYYATGPTEVVPGVTGAVNPVAPEINNAPLATGLSVANGPYYRGDDQAYQIAHQPFRAMILRDERFVPPMTPQLAGLYRWVELAPGPGRTPRSDDQSGFLYDGPGAVQAFSNGFFFTSNNSIAPPQAAREVTGNATVPDRTVVWIDPQAGYAFRWSATTPVPRVARFVGGTDAPCYLPGATADVPSTGAVSPRLLLEAGAADLRVNSGRAVPLKIDSDLFRTGRYVGAFPDGTTGTTTAVTWTTYQPNTTAGLLQATQVGGAFDDIGVIYNRFWQDFRTGDKAVAGSLFLFANSTSTEGGGFQTFGVGDYRGRTSVLSTLPPLVAATRPDVNVPGRSLTFSLVATVPLVTRLTPITVTIGSWGTIGPFYPTSPVAYVQGLLDALIGPDNGRVTVAFSNGNYVGWNFNFAGGTKGRTDPGPVTCSPEHGVQQNSFQLPVTGVPVVTDLGAAVPAEPIGCLVAGGGGGLTYDQGYASYAGGVGSAGPFYNTNRQAALLGWVGPGLSTQNHAVTGTDVGPLARFWVNTGSTAFPFPTDLPPGSHLLLNALTPLECAAGRGYPVATAGSYGPYALDADGRVSLYTPLDLVPVGVLLNFHAGLCSSAFSGPVGGYTGTFPTADGRVATCVDGFVMSVA